MTETFFLLKKYSQNPTSDETCAVEETFWLYFVVTENRHLTDLGTCAQA
jgi:hypothetical protein